MWPFKKINDRYVKRSEFEELTDEVRSLQLRLRKLRARHLAEENQHAHEETTDLRQQAAAVLTENQKEIASTAVLDRAQLNRTMLAKR